MGDCPILPGPPGLLKHFPVQRTSYPDAFAQKIHPAALNKDLHIPDIRKFRNRINDLPELRGVSFHTVSVVLKVLAEADIRRFSPDRGGKYLGIRGN